MFGSMKGENVVFSFRVMLNFGVSLMKVWRGCPSLVKGDRLRTCWRRPAWVQIPPPAPEDEPLISFNFLKSITFSGVVQT